MLRPRSQAPAWIRRPRSSASTSFGAPHCSLLLVSIEWLFEPPTGFAHWGLDFGPMILSYHFPSRHTSNPHPAFGTPLPRGRGAGGEAALRCTCNERNGPTRHFTQRWSPRQVVTVSDCEGKRLHGFTFRQRHNLSLLPSPFGIRDQALYVFRETPRSDVRSARERERSGSGSVSK